MKIRDCFKKLKIKIEKELPKKTLNLNAKKKNRPNYVTMTAHVNT